MLFVPFVCFYILSETDDPRLNTASVANAAAVASVRSLQCDVLCVRTGSVAVATGESGKRAYRYIRSDDRERLDTVADDLTLRIITTPDVQTVYRRKPPMGSKAGYQNGTIRQTRGRVQNAIDLRSFLLFNFTGYGITGKSHDSILTKYLVTVSENNGLLTIEHSSPSDVPASSATIRSRYIFDTTKNYLITEHQILRIVSQASGKTQSLSSVRRAADFREVVPGVYVPTKLNGQQSTDGVVIDQYTAELTNLQANKPVTDNEFNTVFPTGTEVTDKIKNIEYVVGPQGVPAATPTPYVPGVIAGAGPAERPPPSAPTRTEPRQTGWWVLPLSAFLLIAGVVLYFRRR